VELFQKIGTPSCRSINILFDVDGCEKTEVGEVKQVPEITWLQMRRFRIGLQVCSAPKLLFFLTYLAQTLSSLSR